MSSENNTLKLTELRDDNKKYLAKTRTMKNFLNVRKRLFKAGDGDCDTLPEL